MTAMGDSPLENVLPLESVWWECTFCEPFLCQACFWGKNSFCFVFNLLVFKTTIDSERYRI